MPIHSCHWFGFWILLLFVSWFKILFKIFLRLLSLFCSNYVKQGKKRQRVTALKKKEKIFNIICMYLLLLISKSNMWWYGIWEWPRSPALCLRVHADRHVDFTHKQPRIPFLYFDGWVGDCRHHPPSTFVLRFMGLKLYSFGCPFYFDSLLHHY